MSENSPSFAMSLSGGGFRATLFHLGVVRYLYERGLLKKLTLLTSVSGGSIAAHLVLNWGKYTGSEADFSATAQELIRFTQQDVRGRIVRRWLLGTISILPRLCRIATFGSLLQRHYSALYRDAKLRTLGEQSGAPQLHILSTSLTTGSSCAFTREGFVHERDKEPFLITRPGLPVAVAVAASSAFPPLFPPIRIDKELLNTDEQEFANVQYLADGGVYDNLGLSALGRLCSGAQATDALLLISDAGGNFDWTIGKRYNWIVSRNVRATNILMDRVSKLVPSAGSLAGAKIVTIDIGKELKRSEDSTAQDTSQQASARNIRTDLDAFADNEVLILIRQGYSEARFALSNAGIEPEGTTGSWNPFTNKATDKSEGNTQSPLVLAEDELRIHDAKKRRLRLFSPRDAASWVLVLSVMFWAAVIFIGPSSVVAYRHWRQYARATAPVSGKVIEVITGKPIFRAEVSIQSDLYTNAQQTDSNGDFAMALPAQSGPRSLWISVSAVGYKPFIQYYKKVEPTQSLTVQLSLLKTDPGRDVGQAIAVSIENTTWRGSGGAEVTFEPNGKVVFGDSSAATGNWELNGNHLRFDKGGLITFDMHITDNIMEGESYRANAPNQKGASSLRRVD